MDKFSVIDKKITRLSFFKDSFIHMRHSFLSSKGTDFSTITKYGGYSGTGKFSNHKSKISFNRRY